MDTHQADKSHQNRREKGASELTREGERHMQYLIYNLIFPSQFQGKSETFTCCENSN